jgi:hypothetical protein
VKYIKLTAIFIMLNLTFFMMELFSLKMYYHLELMINKNIIQDDLGIGFSSSFIMIILIPVNIIITTIITCYLNKRSKK